MEVFRGTIYNTHMETWMINNCWKQQNKGALEFDSFLKIVTNLALPACKAGAR